ncbi:MAG: hypothetical protein WA082_02825 [Candidatus Moraniibacteriota bacterium]
MDFIDKNVLSTRRWKMMTLVEANNLITPILRTDCYKLSPALQAKAAEIAKMNIFELKNPWRLNQFEVLDEPAERAFQEFISIYDAECLKFHSPV